MFLGTLENQDQSKAIPFTQMLDELVETGYTGTELGDWGLHAHRPGAAERGAGASGTTW